MIVGSVGPSESGENSLFSCFFALFWKERICPFHDALASAVVALHSKVHVCGVGNGQETSLLPQSTATATGAKCPKRCQRGD